MRTWLFGGALAAASGCAFDASGLGSTGTGLGGASTSDGSTGEAAPGSSGGPTPGNSSAPDADASSEAQGDGGSSTTLASSSGEGTTGASGCLDPTWWDDAWSQRRTLGIVGLGLDAALADAVVMLRLDAARIDYDATKPGGHDLRFVHGGVELPYEIERWEPSGSSWVWLRVPELAPEADAPVRVDMYHGNPSAFAVGDGATTWDGYVSVHHLEDYRDATDNGHDAGSPAFPSATEGRVAGAQLFDGNDDRLIVAGEAAFDFTDALTVEALVRVDGFDVDWQAVVTKGDNAWRMQRDLWSRSVGFGSDTEGANDNLVGNDVVDDNAWHHVAIVYDGTYKRVYVDGTEDAAKTYSGPLRESDDEVMIGANSGFGGRELEGRVDEVRISSVARSADYFAWHAHALADEVVQWGAPESCTP